MRNLGKVPRCQAATPREMDSERTRPRILGAHEELPFPLSTLGVKQEACCRFEAREDFPREGFASESSWAPMDTKGMGAGPAQQLLTHTDSLYTRPGRDSCSTSWVCWSSCWPSTAGASPSSTCTPSPPGPTPKTQPTAWAARQTSPRRAPRPGYNLGKTRKTQVVPTSLSREETPRLQAKQGERGTCVHNLVCVCKQGVCALNPVCLKKMCI